MPNIKCYFFLFIISICTCQKADLSQVENLRGNSIAIVGHGGMGFVSPNVNLPSNSLESIVKAVENYQTDGVEVDVQMSADGTLFLYHDSRLQTLTDCVGCLYQWSATDLDQCKYVGGFNTQQFNDLTLVRLESILGRFQDRIPRPLIFLDLKTSIDCPHSFDYQSFETSYLESLVELYERFDCTDWVITEAASLAFLTKLKAANPLIKVNYFGVINHTNILQAMEHDFFGLSANFDQASEAAIHQAHEAGLFVTLGVQQTKADAIEMIDKNVDFIYSDNIPLLQNILR